jgi:hypothetical protein
LVPTEQEESSVSSSVEPELEPPELEPLELEPPELEPPELEPPELEPPELEPPELEPLESEPLESEPPELPPPSLPPELPPLLLPEARALLTCRMAGATKAPTAPRPRSDSSLRRSLFTVSVMAFSLFAVVRNTS